MNPETPCRVNHFQSTKNTQRNPYHENQTKPCSEPEESGPGTVSGSLRVWEFRVPSLSGQSQAGVPPAPGAEDGLPPFPNTSLDTSLNVCDDEVCGGLIHSFIHSVSFYGATFPSTSNRSPEGPRVLVCGGATGGSWLRGIWAGEHFGKVRLEKGSGAGDREGKHIMATATNCVPRPGPASPVLMASL